MGQVKHFYEEHGYYPPANDIFVCESCFENSGIKNYIKKNGSSGKCTYCSDFESKNVTIITLDEFLDFFQNSIAAEWGDPNNEGVGWESREGGWVSAAVYDIYDLLDNVGIEINHSELIEKIISIFCDREWCQKDPHGLLLDKGLYYSWQRFANQIKYESRYVFFKIKSSDDYSNYSDVTKEPHEIMSHLGEIITKNGLVKTISKNAIFYRARASKKNLKFSTVSELAPPEQNLAIYSNRMSPAGIPLFYGALDKQTAINEIVDQDVKHKIVISIATFQSLEEFKILDLTNIPKIPTIFDETTAEYRWSLSFLHSFLADFTKPITKNGNEHIDYVPTQVITEYFRYLFSSIENEKIRGILYPSSRTSNGKACVLFFNQTHCKEDKETQNKWGKKWLTLLKNRTEYLKILP